MSDISEAGLAKRIEELSAERKPQEREQGPTDQEQGRGDRARDAPRQGRDPDDRARRLPEDGDGGAGREGRDDRGPHRQAPGPRPPRRVRGRRHVRRAGRYEDRQGTKTQAGRRGHDRHRLEAHPIQGRGRDADAQTVAKTLGEAAKAHPFLFSAVDSAADAAARPIAVTAREGGPGAGKGETSASILAASAASAVRPARAEVEGRL